MIQVHVDDSIAPIPIGFERMELTTGETKILEAARQVIAAKRDEIASLKDQLCDALRERNDALAEVARLKAGRPKVHFYRGIRSKLWHWGLIEPSKHAWPTREGAEAEARDCGFEVVE